jgi:hypothetical protein
VIVTQETYIRNLCNVRGYFFEKGPLEITLTNAQMLLVTLAENENRLAAGMESRITREQYRAIAKALWVGEKEIK